MTFLGEVSLIDGPVPILLWVVGAVAFLFLLLRRSWRWWLFAGIVAGVAVAGALWASWAVIHVFYWWAEELPQIITVNAAIAFWAVIVGGTTALGGLRRRRPSSASAKRRVGAVMATLVLLSFAGAQVNAYFGEYPTVARLLGQHAQVSQGALPPVQYAPSDRFEVTGAPSRWQSTSALPAQGRLYSAAIPGTVSGFHGRKALIYLPPAYFVQSRPILPVLVLISGQPGSPQSWLRSTKLVEDLDAFATQHNGLAPIVVIPDPNGSDSHNTLCMDSKLARTDTYVSIDVVGWIKEHVDADTNPQHWAVGGFSYGGTCSLQMVTRHPEQFTTFMAISPEREPALAAQRAVTIERAFGGDSKAFDAILPLTLLAKYRYPDTHGFFASGANDVTYSANVQVLEKAAKAAGMTTESAVFPGGHSWAVASRALTPGLGFVYSRIGLVQ